MIKKIDWTNHIIEFVTVVIGILLAFALNNFNENKKEENKAQEYLNGIKKEVELNLEHLEEKLTYHSNILKSLENTPLETVLQLRLAKPKSYAWKLAENDIFKNHSDFDTYYELSNIYSLQETLDATNKEANSNMTYLNIIGPYHFISAGTKENAFEIMSDSTFRIGMKQGWVPVFQDITSYETDLIGMYKHFLKNH